MRNWYFLSCVWPQYGKLVNQDCLLVFLNFPTRSAAHRNLVLVTIGNTYKLEWSSGFYKVVQIWPGRFECIQVTVCPGHIWTTLHFLPPAKSLKDKAPRQTLGVEGFVGEGGHKLTEYWNLFWFVWNELCSSDRRQYSGSIHKSLLTTNRATFGYNAYKCFDYGTVGTFIEFTPSVTLGFLLHYNQRRIPLSQDVWTQYFTQF
jgi:hypothetical protein